MPPSDFYIPKPNSDEGKLLKFLDEVDSEAEGGRRDIEKGWAENMKQVRGDQWRLKRNPYFLANITKNQLRRKVATLTEAKPQVQVRSKKPDLTKAQMVLYNACRSILDQSHTDDNLERVCRFGMTCGSSFLGVVYDPAEDDVFVPFIDPRRVYIDPGLTAASEIDKAQYVRIDTMMPLSDVRMRFPGRGALVKPDDRASAVHQPQRHRTSVLSAVLSMMPQPYRPGAPPKPGPVPRAVVKEYWLRDSQLGEDGTLLFPTGRRIVRASNVILLDQPNPYIDGGWPIEMFEWEVDFDSAWGMDEIEDLRRLQEALNRMGDAWIRNLLLSSNFKIIGDVDALDPDQWDKIDNEAGLIIRKKPTRSLEYVPSVPMDQSIPGALEAIIRLADMLTGNSESKPSQMAQGSAAYDGLQMSRQTLVRAVSRRLESMLERVGQKLISRVYQFMTSDRILFQQGPSREWMAYTYSRQQILQDDEGNYRPLEEQERMFKDFRFLVTPGSSLASTRVQRVMAALQLRSATGVAPSIRRILAEADLGDVDTLLQEAIEEAKWLPAPPPEKGRGGRQ